MEKQNNIYTALMEFQKKGVSIKKGSQNPHFKNKYADINEIMEKVKAPLNELGVLIIQTPEAEGLKTILRHTESETEVTSFLPFLQKQDAQKLGSNITYNRRYALVSMLCLEDDDDDGQKASQKDTPVRSAEDAIRKVSIEDAIHKLKVCTTLDNLQKVWNELPSHIKKDNEVEAKKDEMKKTLS